jgi:hypothetical protein
VSFEIVVSTGVVIPPHPKLQAADITPAFAEEPAFALA